MNILKTEYKKGGRKMNNNYDELTGQLLSGEGGAKLNAKKGQLQDLANSADGKNVKAMLEKNGSLETALKKGDMETVKSAVSGILQTESGARLAAQLRDLMK